MTRMNRRRFTWVATTGLASAALVACGNESLDQNLTPTRISNAEGAPPTLAPNATPFSSEQGGGAEATQAPSGGGGGGPQTHVVKMENDLVFHPDTLTLNVGDTVTWHNNGQIQHTSTADPSQATNPDEHVKLPEGADTWDSGLLNQGEEFSVTFDVAGEYTYFCIPHEAAGMIGHLTVQEGSASGGQEQAAATAEEGTAAASGGGEAVTVTAMDALQFDPSEIEAAPGQDIHVVNGGAMQHDFIIDELGIGTDLLNGGDEQTITVPDDAEVGQSYKYYCSVPGHRQAGMEGTITIVEGGGGSAATTNQDETAQQAGAT